MAMTLAKTILITTNTVVDYASDYRSCALDDYSDYSTLRGTTVSITGRSASTSSAIDPKIINREREVQKPF
jgi:hypothetical protein